MALFLYNLCLLIASPLIVLSYLIKLYQRPDYRQRWAERFGYFPRPKHTGGLHIHAVSLGEAKVAAKVVNHIRSQHPQLPIVFTCSTATASAFIQGQYKGQVEHCYLPFDFPWVVALFIRRYQPRACVITEVEWWPNLIHQHHQRSNPIIMINAKMTASSARTYQRLRPLFNTMSTRVSKVLAQNASSLSLFLDLGLTDRQLQLSNNIKFDEPRPEQQPTFITTLKQQIGDRPVWIAGSTHDEDELAALAAFQRLKVQHPLLLLILVPRHPERFATVYHACLQQGFQVSRRSLEQSVTNQTDILLGDTLGELGALYSVSDMAFIGGSITNRGGHNPLEAAIYGIPMLMGPSQFNAADITASLVDAGALTIINDAEEMAAIIEQWLSHPASREAAGACSTAAIEANQGALAMTLAELEPLIIEREIP